MDCFSHIGWRSANLHLRKLFRRDAEILPPAQIVGSEGEVQWLEQLRGIRDDRAEIAATSRAEGTPIIIDDRHLEVEFC